MALETSAQNLWDEVKENEDFRDQFLGPDYDDKVKRYAGPGWRKDVDTIDFENISQEWISMFLPLLASGNPRCRGTTPRRGVPQLLARAVQLAQNRNMELTNFKGLIELMAVDWAFKWGCAITSSEPRPGYRHLDDPPYRPATYRLSPTRFIADFASALTPDEMRFKGHMLIRDKDDILKEAKAKPTLGWNTKLVMSLPEDRTRADRYQHHRVSNKRREVELYEIWVPEHTLETAVDEDGDEFTPTEEEGFYGTIFTIARYGNATGNQPRSSEYLRAPRPYWGPRSGPYTFGGYLPVPDNTIPLSPIAGFEAQSEELNAQRRAITAAIERYKRFIAVDGSVSEDTADKVRDVEDLEVAVFEGMSGSVRDHMQQVEIGGITQQHLMHLQVLRQGLDKVAGMSDPQRGTGSGFDTATEAAIASQASGQRFGYMTEKFTQTIVQQIIQKESWYVINDPSYREHLGDEAAGMFQDPDTGEPVEEVIYEGGGDNVHLLEEMDIRVEPISMRYTSEALEAERSMKMDNWLLTWLPILPQVAPYVNLDLMLEMKAEELGDPRVKDMILQEQLQMMSALALQGMLPQQGTSGQPRLGPDVAPHLKAAEQPGGFSKNARPQTRKAGRQTMESSETHDTMSASTQV
jgi:hypothetical protein